MDKEPKSETEIKVRVRATNLGKKPPRIPVSGVSVIALVASIIAISMGSIAMLSSTIYKETSAKIGVDLFDSPVKLESLVEKARRATVTIYCKDVSGSGWGIDLNDVSTSKEDDRYPFEIVTNYHVIEDCIDSEKVSFSIGDSNQRFEAKIWGYDGKDNDIALLITRTKVNVLDFTRVAPKIGQWVMAVGSPGSWAANGGLLKGNVTFGRVTNIFGTTVVTDAAVNHGNSGGPLVNALGEVVGTNSWIELKDEVDNIAYAQGTPVLCESIVKCGNHIYWK